MNQPLTDDLEGLFDWQFLNETRIDILPEHLQSAVNLSMSIELPQQRWQAYITALGTLGFEQWLKERAPDLQINSNSASIWQPGYAYLLSAACNIQVGDFKVCLIPASNLTQEYSVPFAVFDIPNLAAHFYVLIQVQEEIQQLAVSGFMNYEQYQRYQQTAHLEVESDWTYTLPSTCFNSNPDLLLLNLRCLDASAIQLPVAPTIKTDTVTALRQKLIKIQSQLQTHLIWKLLTVAEGITLLNNPDLLNGIQQPLINVGLWLCNQIDTVAQGLEWILMPPFPEFRQLRPTSQFRGLEEFELIRTGLEQQGVHIPSLARGAYRDLNCETGSLRMYAITWILSESKENPEWILLVALGSQPQGKMPTKLHLNIRDKIEVLFADTIQDTSQGVIYAQVMGNLGERFWVTVTANDDAIFEIPPFGLELEI